MINCLQPFSGSTGARLIGRERHALVVCSLSIIPPVPDLTGTPLCLEADYTDLPRPDWADLVKEVATGMTIVPAEMSVSVGLEALRLLDKLSKIVGVESCRRCYYPQDACSCQHSTSVGVTTQGTKAQASSAVYSTASSAGQLTQLATQAAPNPGAGLLGAPPGLPPLNLRTWSDVASYWNPSDSEFPALGGYKASVDLDTPFIPQVTLPPKKAPIKAPSPQDAAPGDVSETTPEQSQPMDTTPAPLKLQGPSKTTRQSTPRTQQQQQKSTLRGVSRGALPIRGAFRASTPSIGRGRGIAALAKQTGSAGTPKPQDRSRPQERQRGRGRGLTNRSATPSGRGRPSGVGRGGSRSRERGSKSADRQRRVADRQRRVETESAPVGASGDHAEAANPEGLPPTEGEEGLHRKKHKATGWKKELPRIFVRHMLDHPVTGLDVMGPDERKVLKEKMMTHLNEHLDEWHHQREVDPLGFGPYLYDTFLKVNGIRIESFKTDVQWIQAGTWYHLAIINNGQLNKVEHLKDAPPPGRNVQRPSDQALSNHKLSFEKAYKDAQDSVEVLVRIQTDIEEIQIRLKSDAANTERLQSRLSSVKKDYEEAKGLAQEIDAHLAHVATQYAQMLRVLQKSVTPARRPRPLEAFPFLMLPPPPPQDAPQQPKATPSPSVPSQQGTPKPATTPSATPSHKASTGTRTNTPPQKSSEEGAQWSPVRRSNKRKVETGSASSGRYLTADALRDRQGRKESLSHMLEAVAELTYPTCTKLYDVLCKAYPTRKEPFCRRLSNEVYCCIEYHLLLSACRRADEIPMLVSERIDNLLPPLAEYKQIKAWLQSGDVRENKKAGVLRIAVWLQQCEMFATHGEEAKYLVDPMSQTETTLCELLLGSGSLFMPLETVLGRVSAENQALVRQELLDAEGTLPGLVKDRESEEVHLQRRHKALNEAKTPSARSKQAELLGRLEDKLKRTESRIEVVRTTILKHRARLAFLSRKYPDQGPTQVDLVELLDPPVDLTQELAEEQLQAAPQAVSMETDSSEAALVEPPQESGSAPQSSPPGGDLGHDEMEVGEDERVVIHASDDEADKLFGGQAGDQSPISAQDDEVLLPTEETGERSDASPGVATSMAALEVGAEDDSSTTTAS